MAVSYRIVRVAEMPKSNTTLKDSPTRQPSDRIAHVAACVGYLSPLVGTMIAAPLAEFLPYGVHSSAFQIVVLAGFVIIPSLAFLAGTIHCLCFKVRTTPFFTNVIGLMIVGSYVLWQVFLF